MFFFVQTPPLRKPLCNLVWIDIIRYIAGSVQYSRMYIFVILQESRKTQERPLWYIRLSWRTRKTHVHSHEIVPITVFLCLWSWKLYQLIKSRNKSDFPVVLGKLYTDIYNLPRFFVQDLCENSTQRPLKHQKCRVRRSIYIFYNNTFPQNKELLQKLEWFFVKVWMKF